MTKTLPKILCLFILLLCASCDKEDDPAAADKEQAVNYFPLTMGSTWLHVNITYSPELELTTTNVRTVQANGKQYTEVESRSSNSNSASKSYIRQEGGVYYINSNPLGGGTDHVLLKADAAEGATWERTDQMGNRFKTTLLRKGISRLVNGTMFKDVLSVKIEAMSAAGSLTTVTQAYYANGVGTIMVEDATTAVHMVQYLKSYSIVK